MLRVRNYSYAPHLEREGRLICPLPSPPNIDPNREWYANLKPYERLFYHQTLSSVRCSKRFVATSQIPKDSLDFQLQSRYVHSRENFPESVDYVLQTETCCPMPQTFRVLRNTRDVKVPTPDKMGHPLKIGGIKEKLSPHSVKLINSGPHTQLVNNGYSRQPADGNFFRY
ncbi:cilia- and flagella-associated protein 276 [Musca domestica]|nr:cilia- and flagella-associated protein 276 [Musca domestica]